MIMSEGTFRVSRRDGTIAFVVVKSLRYAVQAAFEPLRTMSKQEFWNGGMIPELLKGAIERSVGETVGDDIKCEVKVITNEDVTLPPPILERSQVRVTMIIGCRRVSFEIMYPGSHCENVYYSALGEIVIEDW
jgi:hypothetical protein